MPRPNIQIDDEVREMTEEEYQTLLDSGWTEEPVTEEPAPVEEAQTSTDAG
jgi:hypothetical protein